MGLFAAKTPQDACQEAAVLRALNLTGNRKKILGTFANATLR